MLFIFGIYLLFVKEPRTKPRADNGEWGLQEREQSMAEGREGKLQGKWNRYLHVGTGGSK